MKQIVEQAIAKWGMRGAQWSLVAARENHVYRLEFAQKSYALRLHREDLRTDAELRSELQWMAALGREDIGVSAPVPATDGSFLHMIDGVQIDILNWLPGRPLGATGSGIDHRDRLGIFQKVGQEMARLHEISNSWKRPSAFSRWSWDRSGLLGDTPLWGRFWENPTLGTYDRTLLMDFRNAANSDLQRLENNLDYGLIHADLVRENIIVDAGRVWLIDFDDSGFGFRLFDIATTLLKNMREPDYDQLCDALLTGYRTERQICTDHLPLFMALRAATYVGWVSSRLEEEGSVQRNRRFVEDARELLSQYLKQRERNQ